jgi:hypothetical protein
MKNWKTTLFGLLAMLFSGLMVISELPPVWLKVLALLPNFCNGLGNMFARDADVSSAQMGLGKEGETA